MTHQVSIDVSDDNMVSCLLSLPLYHTRAAASQTHTFTHVIHSITLGKKMKEVERKTWSWQNFYYVFRWITRIASFFYHLPLKASLAVVACQTLSEMSKWMFRTFLHENFVFLRCASLTFVTWLNLLTGKQIEEGGRKIKERRQTEEGRRQWNVTETESLNGAEILSVCREYQITLQSHSFGLGAPWLFPPFLCNRR